MRPHRVWNIATDRLQVVLYPINTTQYIRQRGYQHMEWILSFVPRQLCWARCTDAVPWFPVVQVVLIWTERDKDSMKSCPRTCSIWGGEWWVVGGGWWVVSGGGEWWVVVVSGEWWVVGGEWHGEWRVAHPFYNSLTHWFFQPLGKHEPDDTGSIYRPSASVWVFTLITFHRPASEGRGPGAVNIIKSVPIHTIYDVYMAELAWLSS